MSYLDIFMKTLDTILRQFLDRVPYIIIGIVFLFITHYVVKLCAYLVENSLRRLWIRANLVLILRKLTSILLWVIGLLIVSSILFPSVTPGNILATLGLSSIALGFAFKDIFENFLAGILILLREPFHIGDYIETKNEEGVVEHVSVRNTHLRRSDGVHIVVPNAVLFGNSLRVLTDLRFRRQHVTCVVNLDVDLEKVREIITAAVNQAKTINKDKGVQVYVSLLTSAGISFDIYWWSASTPGDVRLSRDEVLSNIKKSLDAEHIDLSQTYNVDFEQSVPIELNTKPNVATKNVTKTQE